MRRQKWVSEKAEISVVWEIEFPLEASRATTGSMLAGIRALVDVVPRAQLPLCTQAPCIHTNTDVACMLRVPRECRIIFPRRLENTVKMRLAPTTSPLGDARLDTRRDFYSIEKVSPALPRLLRSSRFRSIWRCDVCAAHVDLDSWGEEEIFFVSGIIILSLVNPLSV